MLQDKISICIVDDNKDICNILFEYFESVEDMEVLSIDYDGESGLASIIKYEPDIVLLDFIMPKIDGLHMLKKLKELNSKSKVIMLTAVNHDPIANEAFVLGSYYYMLKPFKLSLLEERIRSIYNFHQSNTKEETSHPQNNEALIIKSVIDIGIPTNVLGYQYIVDSISMLINSSSQLLVKDLYQTLADKNITTVSCIESAIRNAILQAYKQGREPFIKLFGNSAKRPTNLQFLTKLSQDIKVRLIGKINS